MSFWTIGFAVAALVVVVVAVLLLGIIYQCQRIIRLARAGLDAAEAIDANTRCIWSLGKTTAVAGTLAEGAAAIEANATTIARSLARGDEHEAA
jgi:hypothetical protein